MFSTTAVTSGFLFVAVANAFNSSACQAVDITMGLHRHICLNFHGLELHAPSSRAHSCDGQRLSLRSRRCNSGHVRILVLILANGCARVSRATPLWLSRSCISVLFGISTCEQLETVVSWQAAEYIERPVCQNRGARLHLLSFINSPLLRR